MKIALLFLAACSYQAIAPGHRGLAYDPHDGLKRDILLEGRHKLGMFCWFHACQSIVDFDVTFSTKHEEIHTTSQEGLALDLQLDVIYKPIVAELYELDSEVGQNYYDEVVGPEFRSAASGLFARHSYTELAAGKEKIEDELERDVQRRIQGKHIAITSITLSSISYAPEIPEAVRARLVAEQQVARDKAQLENDALKAKLTLESDTARRQQDIQNKAAENKIRLETELEQKRNERAIAEEDAALEKARAQATIAKAHAEAEAITILAKAHAEENRAQTQAISPLTVQMSAYEALGKLGGNGTTIMLGDFSHMPQFLFPPGLVPQLTALKR